MSASWKVWGAWGAAFVLLEMPAALKHRLPFQVPWNTLSGTVWNAIQDTDGVVAIPVVGGLEVLKWHLVAPKTFDTAEKIRRALR